MTDALLLPDRRRPEPLWHQVEQAVRARIAQNLWPPGSRLPAEDKLCELLGVSRINLRHAMRNLEAGGVLRREHGRGTFVRNATLVAGARYQFEAPSPSRYTEPPRRTETTVPSAARPGGASSSRCDCRAGTGW